MDAWDDGNGTSSNSLSIQVVLPRSAAAITISTPLAGEFLEYVTPSCILAVFPPPRSSRLNPNAFKPFLVVATLRHLASVPQCARKSRLSEEKMTAGLGFDAAV